MDSLTNITATIKQALREHEVSDVLSVVTGNFVGLIVALAEQGGADPDKEIFIDGTPGRSITIHAKKGGAA